MIKYFIFFNLFLINLSVIAQVESTSSKSDEKIVSLTVTGQGKTIEEAKQNALRSAVEQAFGAFISSKSEILNDNLIKDEVISVSNGNIQKYSVISEEKITNGSFVISLSAEVSINKLTNFCKSKGVEVEFGGELFAYNLRLKKLNTEKELSAVKNLRTVLNQIALKSFDYKINTNDPISVNGDPNGMWFINSNIEITPNSNFTKYINLLFKTLETISIPKLEAEEYKKQNILIYPVYVSDVFINEYKTFRGTEQADQLFFRNKYTIASIVEILLDLQLAIYNFNIQNGISTISGKELWSYYNCISNNNGNGGGCVGKFGLTDTDGITINQDKEIIQFNTNDLTTHFSFTPYRLISDLNIYNFYYKDEKGKLKYLINFLEAIDSGIGIFLKQVSNNLKYEIQIKEKRSESDIMKINKYKITPNY